MREVDELLQRNLIQWLMDSDPAIRWQVMRDLSDASPQDVAAERARVASEGWGARLISLQRPDGQWEGGTPTFTSPEWSEWWHKMPPDRKGTLFPEWTSTTWSLTLLRAFGLDPASSQARRAVSLVRENVRWEHDGEPFFAGEVEPCINGRTVALGAHFGRAATPLAQRLPGDRPVVRRRTQRARPDDRRPRGLDAVLLPDLLALRHPARPRLPARRRRH